MYNQKTLERSHRFLYSSLMILLFTVMLFGCGDKTDKPETIKDPVNKTEPVKEAEQNIKDKKEESDKFAPESEDEQMSKNIANYLANDFAKNDLKSLETNDRKFQMYLIDLNGDGKDEYFVRLYGTYYCGSGGCTFLLLDRYSEIITKFSVTDAPIYVSSEKENGWDVLYLLSDGKYRKTVYGKKGYPSNPSVLPGADFKPGATDKALFDDEKNPCKTYDF